MIYLVINGLPTGWRHLNCGKGHVMKTLIVAIIVIAANMCWGVSDTDPYLIPDSFIQASSEGIVILNNYVLGMPLWPQGVPDEAIQWNEAEWIENRSADRNEFGLNRAVHYVDKPSLMVLKSDAGSTSKPALVIFPGGAFERVVLDKEGFDVARWYLRYGITCIVVKYRTSLQYTDDTIFQAIHADGQRAVQIVRSHAAEWSIDPNKIGIMGFSAGGYLAHSLLFDHGAGLHESYDAIGQVPFYPDFCCLTYAAWIPYHEPEDITANTAPTFLTGCRDDSYVNVTNYYAIANGLTAFSIPNEVLLFNSGGHGFGLGVNGGEVAAWPRAFLKWLSQTSFMSDPNGPIANTTMGNRFYSVQCALDGAKQGDTIVMQPGLYKENLILEQDLNLQSVDPNDPYYIGGTIIQGDQEAPVLSLSGNTAACTLAGLTIRAGSVGVSGTATGAALRNCRIMDNTSHGLELFEGGSPHLNRCLITANGGTGITMHETGGRATIFCKPVIENCVIVQNSEESLVGGQPVVTNSIVQ